MWPPNRLPAVIARSRLTPPPGRKSPRLLRRSVSATASNSRRSPFLTTTVRQTPFTQTLSPIAHPGPMRGALTVRRDDSPARRTAATTPTSSINPVNIAYQREVGAEAARREVMDRNRRAHPRAAGATDRAGRRPAAQQLRRYEKDHAID